MRQYPRARLGEPRLRRAVLGGWLCLALAAPACRGAEPQAVVTLRAEATVTTTEVSLGQVSDIVATPELAARLAGVSLSSAPLPDRTRSIEAAYITLRLRRFGLDPAQVEVRGATVTIHRTAAPLGAIKDAEEEARAVPASAPTLVHQGQLIDVEVRCGGVTIRTAAVACRDGVLGDLIDLRVGQGYRKLQARVTGPGRGLLAITETTP